MPKKKYCVTDSDYNHARFYLADKLRDYGIQFAEEVSIASARDEFITVTDGGEKKGRANRLNSWCEKYLNGHEWRKLKAAIRKRRERWGNHEAKSIMITVEAHKLLSGIAKRDNVTFSEVLEYVLLRTANSTRRIPPRSLRRRPLQ